MRRSQHQAQSPYGSCLLAENHDKLHHSLKKTHKDIKDYAWVVAAAFAHKVEVLFHCVVLTLQHIQGFLLPILLLYSCLLENLCISEFCWMRLQKTHKTPQFWPALLFKLASLMDIQTNSLASFQNPLTEHLSLICNQNF